MEDPPTHGDSADVLRDRISELSTAILRVGASLDVDTVLQAAAEEARRLTGARFGLAAISDDNGGIGDVVTSGLTPEEHEAIAAWPGVPWVSRHVHDLGAPLRLSDLPTYARTAGWPSAPVPCKSLQGAPMIWDGAHIGTFLLGGRTDQSDRRREGEFTEADEEMLVLFASHAAVAVQSARTYHRERRLRADLRALMETAPVGIVVYDAETRKPRRSNQEASRMLAPLALPGRPMSDLPTRVTMRRADGNEVSLEQIRDGEPLRAEEIELSVADGRRLRTLVSTTLTLSQSGKKQSVVAVMQDLSALDELERTRAEFLGLVSHELRAPLAAIKGSSTTVLNASRAYDPAELQQFFRIIDIEADRMDALIGDLLDMGRIETGTLAVVTAPTMVAALVDRARTTFLGGGLQHPVLVDLARDLPPIAADSGRIEQVLTNLLTNAARHSPATAPIRIAATRKNSFVEISVTDRGEGIPDEKLAHLFRKQDGLRGGRDRPGLGLTICKGLVEAHGGRIRAERADTGTRLAFTIPVAPAEAATTAAESNPTASKTGRGASILVVDDDPRTTRYVRDMLADAGYTTYGTGDPDLVAQMIGKLNPSLVLMDLMLPNTDGIELMRSVPGLADRPVIFISAYGRDETIARALGAGACDYIVKPFSPTELTARVGAALRGRVGQGPLEFGELTIDFDRHQVTLAGRQIALTPTEYELLSALSSSGDHVLSYDAIQRRLWPGSEVSADRVRTFVKKLRDKLDDPAGASKYIVNVRGVGYRMVASAE